MESTLRSLRTPHRIQNFINRIPWNYEEEGHTARSVAGVLEHNVAHCIEAALVGAAALALAGQPPLLMDMCAARGFWFTEYLGHADVHVLDGGITAWAQAGLAWKPKASRPNRSNFPSHRICGRWPHTAVSLVRLMIPHA